jgi:ABC-2 type transport system ATP-binding protein
MNEFILKTDGLTKKFGNFMANDSISLNIKKGSIYGLVGRNGAGKTTFMKMICSLSSPTSGEFELCGKKYPHLGSAKAKVGNLIEAPGIYANMSAYDNMRAKAMLMGKADEKVINEILDTVGLSKAGKKHAGKFSLGMKQRLGIGLALLGDPELLVLDEPINGLDPAGVAEIRETLQRLNKEKGITILISSHILGELSKLSTDYGFIDKGSLIKEISNEQLLADCAEFVRLNVNDVNKAASIVGQLGINGIELADNGELRLTGCMGRTDDIVEALVNNKVRVYEIAKQGIDLEEYYLNMIS